MCRGRERTQTLSERHFESSFYRLRCLRFPTCIPLHPSSCCCTGNLAGGLTNREAGRWLRLANHSRRGGVCMEYGCAYFLTEESKDGLLERLWRVRSGDFFFKFDRIAAESESRRKSNRVSGDVWVVFWGNFWGNFVILLRILFGKMFGHGSLVVLVGSRDTFIEGC